MLWVMGFLYYVNSLRSQKEDGRMVALEQRIAELESLLARAKRAGDVLPSQE
jgi:hypothetical protein